MPHTYQLHWFTDTETSNLSEVTINPFIGELVGFKKDSTWPYRSKDTSSSERLFKYAYKTFMFKEQRYTCTVEERNYSQYTYTIFNDSHQGVLKIERNEPLTRYNDLISYITQHFNEKEQRMEKLVEVSKNFKPKHIDIAEPKEINLTIEGTDLRSKFDKVQSYSSELITTINKQISLADTEELSKAFIEAKTNLEKVSVKSTGFLANVSSLTDKIPFTKRIKRSVKNVLSENKTIQSNIDYIFGLVYEKYTLLIDIGTKLQDSKAQFIAQIKAYEELLLESEEYLNSFTDKTTIPMKDIALNTQIKTAIEKNKSKLQKIDGSILAVQATIASLGANLPAYKADLEDEMAIGSLLTSVDNYQEMYKEITTLVSDATKHTAEKTHKVIENLMDIQINDTHTMQYLSDSISRGEKFATMLVDKSEKLAQKVTRDAKFISEIAKGTALPNAKEKYKLFN